MEPPRRAYGGSSSEEIPRLSEGGVARAPICPPQVDGMGRDGTQVSIRDEQSRPVQAVASRPIPTASIHSDQPTYATGTRAPASFQPSRSKGPTNSSEPATNAGASTSPAIPNAGWRTSDWMSAIPARAVHSP